MRAFAVHREVDLGRPQGQRGVGRERERRAAQLHRVDAEQQVVHDRIADEASPRGCPRARCPPAVATSAARSLIAPRTASVISFSPPGFIITYDTRLIRSSPKRICGFIAPAAATTSPLDEVAQMRGDRRRAHVDRDAVDPLAEPRPHGDDLAAAVHRHRHLPPALAQRRLQLLQHAHVAGEAGEPPLELERVLEPAQVARKGRACRAAAPRRSAAGRRDRARCRAPRRPCARPAGAPGCRTARRSRRRPAPAPGTTAGAPARIGWWRQ